MFRNALRILVLVPLLALASYSAHAADAIYTGVFKLTVSVGALSAIPSGGQIWCHARFSAASFSGTIYEDVNIQATGSGKVYSCVLTAPFYWDNGATAPGNLSVFGSVTATIVDADNTNASLVSADLTFPRSSVHFTTAPVTLSATPGKTYTFPTLTVHL